MNSKDVDFFAQPEYSLNKAFMSYLGRWPYQKRSLRICSAIATMMISGATLSGQVIAVVVWRDDMSIMIPTLGPLFVHLALLVKFFHSIIYCDELRVLLDHLRDDWYTQMGQEKEVLSQYAADGRKFTISYGAWMLLSLAVGLILLIIPRLLWAHGYLDITEPPIYPVHLYYTDHDDEYYVYLQPYLCFAVFVLVSLCIATDSLMMVFVQHACGMLSMVGYRLEHMVEGDDLNIELCPDIIGDKSFWILVDCIKKHSKAIEFVNLFESTYSWAFLLMLGLSVISISVTALQALYGANPDSMAECIRQGLVIGCLILHLLIESYFSQRLTDHSLEVYYSLIRSKWYQTSLRTRRLINLMAMKSMVPWVLKAGKMVPISMESFSAVLRTSMSYLTILYSMA